MEERILCSAIWYKDIPIKRLIEFNTLPVNCDRGLVFCGFRHPQCMYTMVSVTGLRSVDSEVGEEVQGFLTSLNRFVDRVEGLEIARLAKQIKHNDHIVQLHSEDLW